MHSGRPAERGVAYLLLLIALAVIALGSVASVSAGSSQARRSAEEALLAIGAEYEQAFISYRAAMPAGGSARNPRTLDELLRDPRFPGVRRHLRRLFPDPLTGEEWGLVRGADGGIAGVYSTAGGSPIKRAGFADAWVGFNEARSYRQWIFGLPTEMRVVFAPPTGP